MEEVTACDKAVHWTLIAANAISGPAYGLSVAFFYITRDVNGNEVGLGLKTFKVVATLSVKVCQIISGAMLLYSVYLIKKFFADKNATEVVNTGLLWRYSISFGLYLFCTVISTIALIIANITGKSNHFDIYSGIRTVDYFGQFLSELILCWILLQWGTVDKDVEVERAKLITDPEDPEYQEEVHQTEFT